MKITFEVNIKLTWSKIMAFVFIVLGTIVTLVLKSAIVFQVSVVASLMALGFKQATDIFRSQAPQQTPQQNGNTGSGSAPKEVDKKDME